MDVSLIRRGAILHHYSTRAGKTKWFVVLNAHWPDPNDVLIQYTGVPGAGTAQHEVQDIALVEMAGDRISQIRDYMTRVDLEP